MEQRGKKGFSLRMTLGATTVIVVVMLVAGILMLVNGSLVPEFSIEPSTNPARDIAFLLAIPAVLGGLLAVGSKADRRCADDFAFQLLASGAVIGMFTMVVFNAFWALDFLPHAFGIRGMRGQDMMATGLIGWAAGYFTFRVKGLK